VNLSFENKVALVTGAASGIGLATARAFAEAGAAVALADVSGAAVRSAADGLVAAGRADILSVSPALDRYTQGSLLGELWKRPDLSPRDRSIVMRPARLFRVPPMHHQNPACSGRRDEHPVTAGPSGPHLSLREYIGHGLQQLVELLLGRPRGLSGHIDFF
jgi:hypothetical protein